MMNTTRSSFWSNGSIPLIEPELLSSIIGVASDIALVVSGEGIILSVLINRNDTSFGNLEHWEGRHIHDFLKPDSLPKFDAVHQDYKNGKIPVKSVELNHSDNANWEFPIRYSFHPFGTENALLMLGRDLRPIAETQRQLVQAQMSLEQGYESRREFDARYRLLLRTVRDAVVFVSVADGRIKDANDPPPRFWGQRVTNFSVPRSARNSATASARNSSTGWSTPLFPTHPSGWRSSRAGVARRLS